ncbi:MAG TPA: preprotein translocase subunit YajC [Longimicrobium sp.]|nr:preprotein translocase subunit YajC [Longimicrobium sp.]
MNTALLMLAQQQGASSIATLIMPLMILAVFYFILVVPQRRQLKAHQQLVSGLEKGDQVVTAGGLMGEITAVRDDSVQIKTGSATVVVERSRIVKRTTPGGETISSERK